MAALYVAAGRAGRRETVAAVALFTIAIVAPHLAAMGSVEIIADPMRTTAASFSLSKTGLAVSIAGAMAFVSVMAISFLKAREIGMRIPFSFFEIASFIYDYNGEPVRSGVQSLEN